MNILIYLSKIYNKYKTSIGFILIVIILFLLVMNNMEKMLEEGRGSSNNYITTTSVNNQNISLRDVVNSISNNTQNNTTEEDIKKIEASISSAEEMVEAFILLCNNKQTDLAYNMLSDECKDVLYPTKNEFINLYINSYFNTLKEYTISSYKQNTYKVCIYNNPITTGGTIQNQSIDYITIDDNNKLNISSFISKETTNIFKSTSYVDITITEKITFLEQEIYNVKFKNYTKAKLYFSNTMNNNVFIKSSNNTIYYFNNSEYTQDDLSILGQQEKEIKLKFNKTYDSDNTTQTISFNLQTQNFEYYDTNLNTKKYTTYPGRVLVEINL